MRWSKLFSAFVVVIFVARAASAAPVHLRCEYLENPLGLDTFAPHLSWQSNNTERNWKQLAYEVLVSSSADLSRSGRADIWDSGKTESADSVGIAYHGPALESRRRYFWKVRVWDASGQVSESTEAAWWEMGLLSSTDWKASWIRWKNPEEDADRRAIRWIWMRGQDAFSVAPGTVATFRIRFNISETPRDATLFLATRGDFVATVNGHEVDTKSRWGAFDRRDISGQLVSGQNSIEVKVTSAKTKVAALAAAVKIMRSDGSILRFPTNEKWEASGDTSSWKPAQVVADLTDKRLGEAESLPQPAAYLRRAIAISKNVKSARLYVTALGSYRIFLNGNRVGSRCHDA